MDTLHLGVITLLRSALNGEALELPASLDWDKVTELLYNHNLTGLGMQGAVLCGVPRTHPALVRLTAWFCQDLQIGRRQMQKFRQVCELFDDAGIDYMPVKGAVIKGLYPCPEHRVMVDVDMLIRPEQYEQIVQLLPSVGLREEGNCDYEYTWKSPELMLELHRCLVASHVQDYYDYYRDSWRLARKNESGSGHHLGAEDHYVYFFVHFAKHYRNGTICAKDICDFQVWRQRHPGMDEAYILRQMQQLGLADFYRHMTELLDSWFRGSPAGEVTELITRSAFRGGVHEDFNQSAADNVMRRHAGRTDPLWKMKLKWLRRALFPTRVSMTYHYPVLKKYPVLLPGCWVLRWFRALHERDRLKRGMIVMNMDGDKLSEYDAHMAKVGLEPETKA